MSRMQEKEKRRRRRNDRKRMVRKATRIARATFCFAPSIMDTVFGRMEKERWIKEYAARGADNLQRCSCQMCGNPRRSSKGKDRLTLQERKFE
jgi:hypothetical protein